MFSQSAITNMLEAVRTRYGCEPKHVVTTWLSEWLRGEEIWRGDVASFALAGHSKSGLCYAWPILTGVKKTDERIITALHLPPTTSPASAIRNECLREADARAKAPKADINLEKKYRAVAYTQDATKRGNCDCKVVFDKCGYPFVIMDVVAGGKAVSVSPLNAYMLKRSPVPEYDFSYPAVIHLIDQRS
jgi:hypothetical protein